VIFKYFYSVETGPRDYTQLLLQRTADRNCGDGGEHHVALLRVLRPVEPHEVSKYAILLSLVCLSAAIDHPSNDRFPFVGCMVPGDDLFGRMAGCAHAHYEFLIRTQLKDRWLLAGGGLGGEELGTDAQADADRYDCSHPPESFAPQRTAHSGSSTRLTS